MLGGSRFYKPTAGANDITERSALFESFSFEKFDPESVPLVLDYIQTMFRKFISVTGLKSPT